MMVPGEPKHVTYGVLTEYGIILYDVFQTEIN
jgi:hypothetical protein